MNKKIKAIVIALGLVLPSATIIAQEDSRPPRPPGDEDAGFERRPERPERFRRGDRPGRPERFEGAGPERPERPERPRDDREGGGNPPGHFRREFRAGERMDRPPGPVPPLLALIDKNHDGELDQEEISSSAKALAKLDRNGDGKISRDELRPPREMRGHGPDDAEGDGAGPRKFKERRHHDGPPPARPDGRPPREDRQP